MTDRHSLLIALKTIYNEHWTHTKPILISITLTSVCVLLFLLAVPGAQATRLPQDVRDAALKAFERGAVRLDGSIALPDGSIALLLVPPGGKKVKSEPVHFPPAARAPQVVLYDSGWGHILCRKKGEVLTVDLEPGLSDAERKRLASLKLPSDLIVPDGLVLPKSLKSIVGDLTIAVMDDDIIARDDFGQKQKSITKTTGLGNYALASVTDGTIILLDGKSFNKIAEFPTEGTPCGLDFVDGKIYITDQAKSRILILDPVKRKFLGQVDLPPGSTPKGIDSLPNGKFIYVSEAGPGNVALVETATGKVLMKTKVPTGPAAMAMTEDGIYLVVLSATSGDLSVLSTYNQKVVGSIKVGAVPTGVALDSKARIAYVTNRRSNTISVVDISKRTTLNTISCGASPTGVVLSPDAGTLYVSHGQDNSIWSFDTRTFARTGELKLPLDVDFPGPMCLTPDGKTLLVTSQQTDTIVLVDTQKMEVQKQVTTGHRTHAILFVP